MIKWVPSPNFGPRKGVVAPDMAVIHYTAMESCQAAIERLCDPVHEVSAHYVIGRDGAVFQLVKEADRAWHAGVSSWEGDGDVNSRSIGIELDYPGSLANYPPFAADQMDALLELLQDIQTRWTILPNRVVGHSDVAIGRKADPGLKFDWYRLAREGFSASPSSDDSQAEDWDRFCTCLKVHGYDVLGDPAQLLASFRLRWRQGCTGPFDATDAGIAACLSALTQD